MALRSVDQQVARGLALFADMDDEHFDSLMNVAYLQTFPPQVQLITEGDAADFLHVVVSGRVELFARSNGRETSMALVEPVATFILAAVLKDAVYLMSARTLEKSRVLLIPSINIRTLMERDTNFAQAIVSELASSYREVVKAHKNLKLRTGVERLANYLLRHHAQQGGSDHLTLDIDKRLLASMLGMTPENLSRAFGTLRPYGVEVSGAEVRLTKLADLKTLAKANLLIDDPFI